MSVWAALIGGVAGTLVLTSLLRAATELRQTRIDLPFLLGTVVTADRQRAKLVGYVLHLVVGLLFSLAYYVGFLGLGRAGLAPGCGVRRDPWRVRDDRARERPSAGDPPQDGELPLERGLDRPSRGAGVPDAELRACDTRS